MNYTGCWRGWRGGGSHSSIDKPLIGCLAISLEGFLLFALAGNQLLSGMAGFIQKIICRFLSLNQMRSKNCWIDPGTKIKFQDEFDLIILTKSNRIIFNLVILRLPFFAFIFFCVFLMLFFNLWRKLIVVLLYYAFWKSHSPPPRTMQPNYCFRPCTKPVIDTP